MKILKLFLTSSIFWLFAFVLAPVCEAANYYLSPSSTKIGVGETTGVQVRLNTNKEVVNAVSAYVSYPSDKLEVAYVSYSGSAFAIAAENTFGGGLVKISRGNVSGVLGDLRVATIGFRAKTTGSANIGFTSGSAIVRESDSTNILNGSSGSILNVTKESQASAASPDSQKGATPVISDLKVDEVSTDSATITWTTDIDSDSSIEFGLDKDLYILSVNTPNLTKQHKVKVENPILLAGNIYHFIAKSKTDGGVEVRSEDSTFHLKGFNIMVRVENLLNRPLGGAEIYLDAESTNYKTGRDGKVLVSDVSPGNHILTVKFKGRERTQVIEVKNSSTIQEYVMVFSDTSFTFVDYLIWGLIIGSVVFGFTILFLLFIKPKLDKNRTQKLSQPTQQKL